MERFLFIFLFNNANQELNAYHKSATKKQAVQKHYWGIIEIGSRAKPDFYYLLGTNYRKDAIPEFTC